MPVHYGMFCVILQGALPGWYRRRYRPFRPGWSTTPPSSPRNRRVKFVGMSPDIEQLRCVGLQFHKLMGQAEEIVPAAVVIHGGAVFQKIFRLQIKTVGGHKGSGVADAGVLLQQLDHTLVVVLPAIGISQSDHVIAHDLRQRQAVVFHLADHVLIRQIGKHRVGQRMCRHFMSPI